MKIQLGPFSEQLPDLALHESKTSEQEPLSPFPSLLLIHSFFSFHRHLGVLFDALVCVVSRSTVLNTN